MNENSLKGVFVFPRAFLTIGVSSENERGAVIQYFSLERTKRDDSLQEYKQQKLRLLLETKYNAPILTNNFREHYINDSLKLYLVSIKLPFRKSLFKRFMASLFLPRGYYFVLSFWHKSYINHTNKRRILPDNE